MTDIRLARSGYAVFGASLVLLAAITAAALTSSSNPQRDASRPAANDRMQLVQGGVCGPDNGITSSLNEAAKDVPYQLLLPHSPMAAAGSVSSVSLCSQSEMIATFGSGIRVYNDIANIADPASNWAKVASDDAAEASVGALPDGTPALLIDPAKDPTGIARGSVTFVHDGTWVVVEGNGNANISALEHIASTVSAS